MQKLIPELERLANELAARWRKRAEYDPGQTIDRQHIMHDLEVRRFLLEREAAPTSSETGVDPANVASSTGSAADVLSSHLEYMCNFELQLRKTFWVDEALSWMFSTTDIDISGEHLGLPFSCFALVFTDRYALGLAEKVLCGVPTSPLHGRMLQILTVYVTAHSSHGTAHSSHGQQDSERRGIRVAFVLDALNELQPELVLVDLSIEPEADLDATLIRDSGDSQLRDAIAASARTNLCRLAVNAILYATSSEAEPLPVTPSQQSENRKPDAPILSSEEILYLPGKIDITTLHRVKRMHQARHKGERWTRSLVRGHWRRANPSWTDQRPRWVKPHWRGPRKAAIVEKQYRLKP